MEGQFEPYVSMRGCKRAIKNCRIRETVPLWSGENPFIQVLTTRTSYLAREEAPRIRAPSSKPAMARPGSTKSMAEQSERLLQQTARIFPNVPYTPPGITKVFNNFPGGQSTDVPETPRKPDIKQEATKKAGTRMQQPGRRK